MFEITFLGTAASIPSAGRGLPALVVACGGRRILVDCGEGTQRQILRSGLGFRRLERILLTHAHLDHVLGLPGLVATLGLLRTGTTLTIHGSDETLAFVDRCLAAAWPTRGTPVPIRLAEAAPGAAIEEDGFRILPFRVVHGGTRSCGFRFEARARRHFRPERLAALGVPAGPLRAALGRGEAVTLPGGSRIEPDDVLGPARAGPSLAVVGDAEETRSLTAAVRGADALVIEATFLDHDAALARARAHLTATEAARLAAEAGVGTLYLTHLSGRYEKAAVLAEAQRWHPRVHVVEDFERVRVPRAAEDAGAG